MNEEVDNGGYEEDDLRPKKTRDPSFSENVKFGASGARPTGMPNSWGEAFGRLAARNRTPAQTSAAPADASNVATPVDPKAKKPAPFAGILSLLGL